MKFGLERSGRSFIASFHLPLVYFPPGYPSRIIAAVHSGNKE